MSETPTPLTTVVTSEIEITGVGTASSVSGSISAGADTRVTGAVLTGQGVILANTVHDPGVIAIDMATSGAIWQQPDTSVVSALADGGFSEEKEASSGDTEVTVHDSTGAATSTVTLPGGTYHVQNAMWVSSVQTTPGTWALSGMPGPALEMANGPWAIVRGAGDAFSTLFARVKNQSSSILVVKKGACHLGFAELQPGEAYWWPYDGIMPPAWGGDWYKAWPGIQSGVDSSGELYAYGLQTWFETDDENDPNYEFYGGRKHEPRWSAAKPGGWGHEDWKYRRPATYSCGPLPKWFEFWKYL